MSGRSAYVRKKITETRPSATRPGLRSAGSSDDAATITDVLPPVPRHPDTTTGGIGLGTSNARFLQFSQPQSPAAETLATFPFRSTPGPGDLPGGPGRQGSGSGGSGRNNSGSGSQSGGSVDGRREAAMAGGGRKRAPLDDFAYARARRPNIKTEDVSGIEKSGLRSAVDRKSENVRKGLAKAFAFGRKKSDRKEDGMSDEFRPESAATVRMTPATAMMMPDVDIEDVREESETDAGTADALSPISPSDYPRSGPAPPPMGKLPPLPSSANAPPIKRWIGGGRPVQRWNKLRKDPELWDPHGDVLIYLGGRENRERQNPSFRLSSHIIEATESRYLITMLREGSTEDDDMSMSRTGPMHPRHGGGGGYGMASTNVDDIDGQISYEMFFPCPVGLSRAEQVKHHITTRNVFALLYHASLVGLTLYQALSDLHLRLESYMPHGTDTGGAIVRYVIARGIDDVRGDPELAISLLAWSEGPEVRWEDGWREGFVHCAGLAGLASSGAAFSDGDDRSSILEGCTDFKNVTPITRALLERACLETQLRVQAAEERLAEFQYSDMWPPSVATVSSASGPVTISAAKAAADRLQRFLVAHYTSVYGRWPPPPPPPFIAPSGDAVPGTALGGESDEEMWLTRTMAQALQRDFAALYDYLVNRDIVWDGSEARSGRKWELISETGNRGFEADTPDLPITDIFVEFDNAARFPHIPHPFPLLPESIPPTMPNAGSTTGGSKANTKLARKASSTPINGSNPRAGALERRVQLAYTEATNMLILGSDFTQSDLIDAFSRFERTDRIGEVDPHTARRGRWVLIYGILQTLASVSVDAPSTRYRDGVSYHLSPRLKGARMPPWKSHNHSHRGAPLSPDEAAHELSHCWIVPATWGLPSRLQHSGTESSAPSSGGSGNTSPVHRGGYSWPRPPTTGSSTARSSAMGYYPPVPSGFQHQRPPPGLVGSAGSVISETDTMSMSSVRTPASTTSSRRGQRRPGGRTDNSVPVPHKFSNVGRLDEWPEPPSSSHPHGPGMMQGGFLVLDDAMDDARSYVTAPSGPGSASGRSRREIDTGGSVLGLGTARAGRRGGGGRVIGSSDRSGSATRGGGGPGAGVGTGGGYGRPLLSRDDSDSDEIVPVIRDFDQLDVIDDHEP